MKRLPHVGTREQDTEREWTGNVYLMAIIDWFSRKVLSWRVFNTMDALQYANLLRETIEEYGCPTIFNTDQGSQFTSDVFIKVLVNYDIQISMDGKDGLWTTSELSVFGEASSMRTSTLNAMRQ